MPRITVVVPARNAAAHIQEALESIAAQTLADWEAVVVDDGSTDDTASLARRVDDRIRVVENPAPGGAGAARNLAVEHARGDLLAFLDADDRWLPAFLERQLALFDSEQAAGGRVGIVACDAQILENGEVGAQPYSALAGSASGATLETLLRSNPIFVSALVPRAVFLEAGGFEPRTSPSEDHDLWIRILELGYQVIASSERLVIYRKHSSNTSGDPVLMARTSELVYRRALTRGRLTSRQQRIARRSLLFQRSVREIEEAVGRRDDNGSSVRTWVRAARGGAALTWLALCSPRRWPGWVRALLNGRRALWRAKWS